MIPRPPRSTPVPNPTFSRADGSDLQPGQRSEWVCSDEDTRADQVTEYVGDEEVTVEGRRVLARHTRWSTTFSGATERSEEHTSELQSRQYLVCRLLLEKKKT